MRNLKFIFSNVLVLLAILSMGEVTIFVLLNNPSIIPQDWVQSFRDYYMSKDREIAQYSPKLAAYDSALFYRLKPGEHSFNNREFNTRFTVNSYGFRDDESSVKKPKIIVLGDSFTMGWGVSDSECFSSVLERYTKLSTLNTGVSSYGTAREFEVFSGLEVDSLKYLVIQYDMNDNTENCAFSYGGNKYNPSSEEEYNHIRDLHAEAIAYFPFKFTSHFARNYLESAYPEVFTEKETDKPETQTQKEPIERPYITPTDAFLNVLTHSQIPDSVPIIVFQVGDGSTEILIDPLSKLISENDSIINNPIHVLDMQANLNESHYYLLDRHLKPEGHEIVARVLSDYLNELKN